MAFSSSARILSSGVRCYYVGLCMPTILSVQETEAEQFQGLPGLLRKGVQGQPGQLTESCLKNKKK